MALLTADGVCLAYAGRTIFDDTKLAVERGDRLGVIGSNGTGKSTLLKILLGLLVPDAGRVVLARGCRVGYLPQEHGDPGDGALLDSLLSVAPRRGLLEERIQEVEAALERSEDHDEQLTLSEELASLHSDLVDIEKQFASHHAKTILAGLGFSEPEFSKPLRIFSGGWRMRAALAALLFQRPDVLLLDEPTNHLDFPSVEWLSCFLARSQQALVLICHDREFLNRHVRRVASLEIEGLRIYRGNYDQYVEQRAQELELLENRVKKDEQRKKDLESFVERFKAKATKARQAQSRAKQIEKLQERQVDIPRPRRSVSLTFKPTVRAGDTVIRLDRLGHSYGSHRVFSAVNLSVARGDRIAIVGVNGAGKTTLLKLVARELEATEGRITFGLNVTPSYFAQHHTEVLDRDRTVLDAVASAAPSISQTELRGICGAFLFSGDDVDKKIDVLSGGEKARVALARMLAAPGNLLLLDEPTNHLDTESAEKLTASLEGYDGTLLFVSHNLDFARRLSNRVWDVHDGTVEDYPGSLPNYLEHLARRAAEMDAAEGRHDADAVADAAPDAVPRGSPKAPSSKEARIRARDAEAEERRKRSSLEKRVREIEARIGALERAQAETEVALADPKCHSDRERSKTLTFDYERIRRELEAELARWEELQAALGSGTA